LCKQYDTNPAALALSYILSYPEISTVIPGIRVAHHVAWNTQHLVQLDEADKTYLQSLYETDWLPVLDMMQQRG
ncbi:MAG TPA: hypothetical protein DIW54_09015, partial [Chitinophagaceae bacterium]|nr:hypothetical protein [Chitinophagaceae bacterium]